MRTAFLYPTGGYQWPGMGAEIAGSRWRHVIDRVEAALLGLDVPRGALPRLMAGENQARRERAQDGWRWTGDFPLSMVAQTALGVSLSLARIELHGPPAMVAGESMGELAAMCIAGGLSIEETVVLTYRWARDLAKASDRLGLRMSVVEGLDEGETNRLAADVEANIVVSESTHLFVVALPAHRLDELERVVAARGGRSLVSSNHCAAHEPRLASDAATWDAHERFLRGLAFAPPAIPLPSTLHPGTLLGTADALRRNRVETSFHRVRWHETLLHLREQGIGRFILFGPMSCGYALKKLRAEDDRLAGVRIKIIPSLTMV